MQSEAHCYNNIIQHNDTAKHLKFLETLPLIKVDWAMVVHVEIFFTKAETFLGILWKYLETWWTNIYCTFGRTFLGEDREKRQL